MKRGFIFIAILSLFIVFSGEISAQDSACCKPIVYIGGRVHKDFLLQKPKLLTDQLENSFPFNLEMDISWHIRKKEIWDYCYCYPRAGFAIQYMNFAYPDVLGSGFALIPFIEPYIRADKKLHFALRLGVGPTYLTRLHDEETNPDNIFFSSHLSFTSVASFSINYRATDQLSVRLAGNIQHISNANIAQPNLGVNLPTINAGVDYSFQKATFENRAKDPDIVLNPKKNRFDIIASVAAQPASFFESELYPVYSMVGNYSRLLGRVFALSAGVEFNSYRSYRRYISDRNLIDESTGKLIDHKRLAASAGIEWQFGRFIFSQQMGYYLYAPFSEYSFYHRHGISFKISDHILAGLNLKVHARDVDFLDFRVGVYF